MFKTLALLLIVKLYASDLNTQNAEIDAQQQQQQQAEIETEGQKVIAKLTACWVLQSRHKLQKKILKIGQREKLHACNPIQLIYNYLNIY